MSLSVATKAQIHDWYKALQKHIPDFISRAPQRQMIAEVARTLGGESERHLAIEAPTGVGKTLSYLIPGIAISRAEEKPLVVSTANVALQDQIFSKDLPLLRKIIPDLKFTGAFGRRRYVCPRNLAILAADTAFQGDLMLFLDEEMAPATGAEQALCVSLQKALASFAWDGLRDHYTQTVNDPLWSRLSTDKANCLGRNCHYFRECPFFLARKEIENADVVVANHALVMAAMESESVLPEAKNMLLVLDEGHHLPDVARDALEMEGEITLTFVSHQLDQFMRQTEQVLAQFRPAKPPRLSEAGRLKNHCDEILALVLAFGQQAAGFLPRDSVQAEHRFEMGQLPPEMTEIAARLHKLAEELRMLAEFILDDLSEKTAKHDIVKLHQALLQQSRSLGYWESTARLWKLAALQEASNAPISKWLTREMGENGAHLYLHCVGIRVSSQLEKLLWSRVPHVVVTSATLRSLQSFKRMQELSGLKERAGDRFIALDSPFDHRHQGKLVIPLMDNEPVMAREAEHIEEMARFFQAELAAGLHHGMLVLFASHRAMQLFLTHLASQRLCLLVQGDQPRYRLVEAHRRRVEAGKTSVLVGLQSFAEGLDLKGELLTQVHIHKIAFPPIDSPVVLTEGEWLKSQQRHPFEVQSLPVASFNLIQQVGRLIRSHACTGEIVIYDRRLLSKAYGARLLAALPVFPIEQRAV
ncbi:ATP-dependent DNA helicase DinG [Biostraticola tofi]|uniref:ATP-dependent DNA helicase DinG n=1 Tax=Biostraticola tofi TaxID=466109 RepID=A0A4R3YXY1_9GAMM|nr:ATP-dependent DNA helicase DinG [Biostraticola tofi]TCV98077.1 ATP-dependent DNA helicase DinG [Biostraticola tofi]